jgi:hypothetical protein
MLELNHMTVLTLARARECRIPAHSQAQFVCIMEPDGAPPLAVSFVSIERVLEFIDEMQRPSIRIDGASGEDVEALREVLLRPEGFIAPRQAVPCRLAAHQH